jgi:hypothetical protein
MAAFIQQRAKGCEAAGRRPGAEGTATYTERHGCLSRAGEITADLNVAKHLGDILGTMPERVILIGVRG